MISASPDRHTFQKEKYIERRLEEGRSLDDPEVQAMLEYYPHEVAASLRFATVKATRATRGSPQQAPNDDPWVSNNGAEVPF